MVLQRIFEQIPYNSTLADSDTITQEFYLRVSDIDKMIDAMRKSKDVVSRPSDFRN